MHKKAVWLTIDDLQKRYPYLFAHEGFNESFVGMLVNTHLLRGRRVKKKIEVLEESWINLFAHIKYNLSIHWRNYFNETDDLHFSIPFYCERPTCVTVFPDEKNFFTYDEIMEFYPKLKDEIIFSPGFFGQLVTKHLLRGKYNHKLKCKVVLRASFDELMKYRNFNIENWKTDTEEEE